VAGRYADNDAAGLVKKLQGIMMMRAIRLLAGSLALVAGIWAAEAGAVELKVLSAGAMRAALQELAPAFEAASGNKLKIEYSTAGDIEKKVAAGDEIDVAILTKPRVDKLVREAKIVGGSTQTLARAQIGLAVKKGAAKPDISSVEALKKALLNAKSVAYADPASGATSGQYLAQAFEKLDIAVELKPKTRLVSGSAGQGPLVGATVARGEAEIGIQPITELMEVKDIDVVGSLPAELQSPDLAYVAGAPYLSEQPIAAKALIDFLADPKAAAVYKAKGLQPG
jgi:molybdate transport system substrate-binding protein